MNPPTPANAPHHRMLGAALVSRIPGARHSPLALERMEHGLFLLWLAYMGLLVFGALLLWQAGAWHRLIDADPTGLTVTIVLLFTWQFGSAMVIFLAALQSIDKSLYEAASIDGAGKFATFWHITMPLITPVIFFNLIMGTIGAIQEFDRVYVMAGGDGGSGPGDSLLMPVLLLFNNAFRYFKMGYASALAWIIFIVILVLTLLQWAGQKKWVHYEGDAK